MPVYEYYCADCHGVFELLRPVSRAREPQPCPDCDAECQRVLSTSFQMFTLRDGLPRRLPDRGTYWHLEEEVSTPIDRPVQVGEHPERFDAKYGPQPVPTMEELETFEQQERARAEEARAREESGYGPMINQQDVQQRQAFLERQGATAQRSRLAKRRKSNDAITPRTRSGNHENSSSPPPAQAP